MSVRVVARVAPHRRWVKTPQPAGRVIAWPGPPRMGWWARVADDRDLVSVKLAVVGIVALVMMALEVPW